MTIGKKVIGDLEVDGEVILPAGGVQEQLMDKVSKSGDTMIGTLIINPASGDAADFNGPVVLDTQLKVSHPYGVGSVVVSTIDSSTENLYINTADKVGVGLDGANSKTMGVQSGYVLGATSGQLFLSSGGASGGTGNITGTTSVKSGEILAGATGATGNIFASTGISRAGNSGQAIINSGQAITSGNSGAVGAFSGSTATGNSGNCQLNSGIVSVQGVSGNVSVFSGAISAGTGASGSAQLNTGSITAGTGNSGGAIVSSGLVSGSGASGAVQLISGSVANATSTSPSGNIVIRSGDNTGLGLASTIATGAARMRSGSISNASAVGETGNAEFYSGNNAGSGKTGNVSVYTGNNTGTGISGDLALSTGTTASGTRGKVAITSRIVEVNSQLDMQSNKIIDMAAGSVSGDAVEYDQYTTALNLKANTTLSNLGTTAMNADLNFTKGIGVTATIRGKTFVSGEASGQLIIQAGTVSGNVNSGALSLSSGAVINIAGDIGTSGDSTLKSGDTVNGKSGNLILRTGSVVETAASGNLSVVSGTTNSGNAGSATFMSGNSTSGATGDTAYGSGNSTSGNSGNTYVFTGTSGATRGKIELDARVVEILNTDIEFTGSAHTIKNLLNVKVGDSGAATAKVHIVAGTATAGTAPIKLTAGPYLTTPEEGTIEFDGSTLSFTNKAKRRNLVQSTNGITSTTTVENTASQTTLFTQQVLPDELDAEHTIKLNMSGFYSNATASDDFTIRFEFAGKTYTIPRLAGNVTNQFWRMAIEITIRTSGVSGTAIGFVTFQDGNQQYASPDITTFIADTTVLNTLVASVQWDTAKVGNTFSLTQGHLEFLN